MSKIKILPGWKPNLNLENDIIRRFKDENSKTKIKDLVLLKTSIYRDKRGFFKEVEKNKILKKNLFLIVFHIQKKKLLEECIFKKKQSGKNNYGRPRQNT